MKTFVDILLHRAEQQPQVDAYIMLGDDGKEDERLTYEQLNVRAMRVAAYLQSLGLAGERVLLSYPPGLEFVVAFMGCLYAGAVAVPVHPPGRARSTKRFETIIADCDPALALTTHSLDSRFQQDTGTGKLRFVAIETLPTDIELPWIPQKLAPDQLALLQYTSGSTSDPKGVMVTHENLIYMQGVLQQAFGQTSDSIVASWLPFYHDMGLIGGVLQPMFAGAQCILMSPLRFLQRPALWLEAIFRYRVTTSGGPDFAYSYCVQKITAEQRKGLDLSSWEVAFSGSEPVRAATMESFSREFASCGFRSEAFHPCYGLAEATLLVSGFKRCASAVSKTFCADGLKENQAIPSTDSRQVTRLVSSGASSATDRVVIVDPTSLEPCADRSIGEVWVSGPGVAVGYWRKAGESELVFSARLSGDESRTFLRTGDLGFLDDGELFITGRLKDLIIIRGANHFPQDIEETVCSCHPALRMAGGAAFSIAEGEQAEKLVIVQEVERRPDLDFAAIISRIRIALSTRHELQAYVIILVRTGTIPKTPSGKVQRHICRNAFLNEDLKVVAEWRHAGDAVASREIDSDRPPELHDEMQAWLVKELASLLGTDPAGISPDLSFSECGGDSLTAIEMLHRIEALQLTLPVTRLMEGATISAIAAELLANAPRNLHRSIPEMTNRSQYPLSYGQRALWFLQRMAPGSSVYHLSIAVVVRGGLDREALKRSFQRLTARHGTLRSSFGEIGSQPTQFVHAELEPSFVVRDCAGQTSEALRIQMAQDLNRPCDVETGPLLRSVVYDRGEQDPVLLMVVHHLIADFWSLSLMLEDLGHLYRQESGRAPHVALVPGPAYSAFVQQEADLLQSKQGDALWNYWRFRLGGELPVCTLPSDRPRVASRTYRSKTERKLLDSDLVAELKAFAREQGCTLYVLLLAAFKALLFRYTGCEDILIGSPAAGRMVSSFSKLVGYCVNPLPLRTQIAPCEPFPALIREVREVVTGAFTHQQYPFPLLVERLQPERTSVRTALFQMMFTFLRQMPGYPDGMVPLAMGEAGTKCDLNGLEIESFSLDPEFIDFDLVMLAGDAGDSGLNLALHYSSDLFDRRTMSRLIEHFQVVLRTMVKMPGQVLSEFSLLSPEEIKELALTGDGPRTGYSARCIYHLIEDAVQRNPGHRAVLCGNEEITYDVLNKRANQLARYLLSLGAAPDVRIGICLDRSVDMVIALLAILKSGAAYVPLDPGYPSSRLIYMVEDAGIEVIVTNRQHASLFSNVRGVNVCLDVENAAIAGLPSANPKGVATPDNLAYVMYTSGSTGQPKGVMISHRSVINFFAGMDSAIGDQVGTWLAVTSISFDISVLELLWTLSHGFQVEVSRARMPLRTASSSRNRKLDFSLFYFAATDSSANGGKYKLLLDSARFADQSGFQAVWTPERHFHTFGGLYPNPSVTGAALAAVTSRIRIRAGSVVLPLHHPVRVAEEWSVVDNLSDGRVDVSFASGWHVDDFVLAPEHYAIRREQMIRDIETVRRLWRGGSIDATNGNGQKTKVSIYPRPCQPELPIWITAAGSDETFRLAGELGTGLLTHLLGQSVQELAQKIEIYREAWRRSGAAGDGHVTLMLHTFLGEDADEVREIVRGPFCEYLRNSVSLISGFARSLNIDIGSSNCTAADMDVLLRYAFDRYFETSGLFGTFETGVEIATRLQEIGVDEVACLIDFGIDNDSVLQGLQHLKRLRERVTAGEPEQRRITHFQCTPSMAKMLMVDPPSADMVMSVDKLLVGGETVTPALLEMLSVGAQKEIYNVYGPTETTVWSAIERIAAPGTNVSLGRPLANTQIQILDRLMNPVAAGMPGEICIGGDGLARGYLGRPSLTAARFIPDPMGSVPGARLYRTGDQGRWRADGKLEFQGRLDFQVKIRGHRIECGEIEACLQMHSGIKDAAVKAVRDAEGDLRLVAYIVPAAIQSPAVAELREFIAGKLPEHMMPAQFITLSELPLTPNGKVDRNCLPNLDQVRADSVEQYVAPRDALEQVLEDLWSELLKVERVGIHSNFFAVGGHSLLATALVSKLRQIFEIELPLQTFFSNPTIALLRAAILRENGPQLLRKAEILEAVAQLSEEEVETALRSQAVRNHI